MSGVIKVMMVRDDNDMIMIMIMVVDRRWVLV